MNTANLGVDRSLETTIARDQSAILWKIQDAILHLVKLRTPIGEKTSYDGGDANAPYSRHDSNAGRISSNIWTDVRQGNFWTSLQQDFDNSIDWMVSIETPLLQWREYMKWISDKAVIQHLAEEIVFTKWALLDSEIHIRDTLKKSQEIREEYRTTFDAIQTYESNIRHHVGNIIKTPIFPTLEDRHIELLLDKMTGYGRFWGTGGVVVRALMTHLDILSLDIFETQAHFRGIKDTGLFQAIDMRRGVLEREEQP